MLRSSLSAIALALGLVLHESHPPSQKPGSFSLENVMESLQRGVGD